MSKQPSAENLRFMVAGYLGAAAELIKAREVAGAKIALKVVCDYLDMDNVKAPDKLREMAQKAADEPAASLESIGIMERIFVDPLNTEIENSDGKWLT